MARARGYLKTTETPPRKVRVLFAENETVVFTRKYVKHTVLSKTPYGQGKSAIVTNIHKGPLGGITHVDIRLDDGEFYMKCPSITSRPSCQTVRHWWSTSRNATQAQTEPANSFRSLPSWGS